MDIFKLLYTAKAKAASDLHMVTSSPPLLRVNGSLESVNGATPLTAEDISQAFFQVTTPEEREEFQRTLELDFGYTLDGVGPAAGVYQPVNTIIATGDTDGRRYGIAIGL